MKYAEYLYAHGVRPSFQRLALYKHLESRYDHPTAEEAWVALLPSMPTLSRTTVYNTMRLFCDKGVARPILGDGADMRFDANTEPHAHFLCGDCGCVIDAGATALAADAFDIPPGAKVSGIDVYISGFCPKCAKNNDV